LLKREN